MGNKARVLKKLFGLMKLLIITGGALIVGRFDLDDWLNGNLVRSLAIGTDKEGATGWPNHPPFARFKGVWRTTAEFWQEVKEYNILGLSRTTAAVLSCTCTRS